jgi:Clathrin light chain
LQETVIRSAQPTFGAIPHFAPRPQPSALSATPILNQPIDAEEPEVIRSVFFFEEISIPSSLPVQEGLTTAFNRKWRERQAEEIGERDERSKTRRQETIARAERAIDQFYEEYNSKREKQISENKYAIISLRSFLD